MENQSKNVTQDDLGKLDQKEVDLIHLIRTRFRFGDLVISARDGKPYQILRHTEIARIE